MIDDSRRAAMGANSALVWAHRTSPYATTDSAAPRNPTPAYGRSRATVSPRHRQSAYAGIASPSSAISQAM